MRAAAVGFHCPECTQRGARDQRLVQVGLPGATMPRATHFLIGVNVAIFVIGVLLDARPGAQGVTRQFALQTYFAPPLVPATGVAAGEWWRVITGGFLHAGLLHLGFNMVALYSIGGVLERIIGWHRFVAIYGVSLVGGALVAILTTIPQGLTVGASGAIFGLFGAFLFLQLSRGQSALGGIGPVILINLVITFAIPGISVGGHVGGLMFGSACGFLVIGASRMQARDREVHRSRGLAVCAAIGTAAFAAALLVAPIIAENGALVSF